MSGADDFRFRSPQKVARVNAHGTNCWKGSPEDVQMASDTKRTPGSSNKLGGGLPTHQHQAPQSRSVSACSSPIQALNSTRVYFKPIHQIGGDSNQNYLQQPHIDLSEIVDELKTSCLQQQKGQPLHDVQDRCHRTIGSHEVIKAHGIDRQGIAAKSGNSNSNSGLIKTIEKSPDSLNMFKS